MEQLFNYDCDMLPFFGNQLGVLQVWLISGSSTINQITFTANTIYNTDERFFPTVSSIESCPLLFPKTWDKQINHQKNASAHLDNLSRLQMDRIFGDFSSVFQILLVLVLFFVEIHSHFQFFLINLKRHNFHFLHKTYSLLRTFFHFKTR